MKKIVICTVLYNDPENFQKLIKTIDFEKIFKLIVIENSDFKNREINKRIIDNYSLKDKVIYKINELKIKGSAQGFNIGMKIFDQLKGDYLWLIDQDGQLEENSIDFILNNNLSDINIPKIINIRTKEEKDIGLSPAKLNIFGNSMEYSKLKNKMDVDLAPTMGMLINKNVVKKIKYDHKNFFVGREDFDFCIKAKKYGFNIIYFDKFKVFHPNLKEKNGILENKFKNKIKKFIFPLTPKFFGAIEKNGTLKKNHTVYSDSYMNSKYYCKIIYGVNYIYSFFRLILLKIVKKDKVLFLETLNEYKKGYIQGKKDRNL
jgi:GT2 family glycosyltransferase